MVVAHLLAVVVVVLLHKLEQVVVDRLPTLVAAEAHVVTLHHPRVARLLF
jgi:hypothetical protein